MTDLESLKTKITEQRRAGVFHLASNNLAVSEAEEITAVLDSFVTGLGFEAIENSWQEIDFSTARKTIFRILKRDLAYDLPLMSDEEANAFTEEIIKVLHVGQGTRFFTNGDFYEDRFRINPVNFWRPITQATFDTGVIIFNNSNMGLVWVEDED